MSVSCMMDFFERLKQRLNSPIRMEQGIEARSSTRRWSYACLTHFTKFTPSSASLEYLN